MYPLAAQAVHRTQRILRRWIICFDVADFTEVVFEPMAYRLSGRAGQFLFLVMSLSGSQSKIFRRHPMIDFITGILDTSSGLAPLTSGPNVDSNSLSHQHRSNESAPAHYAR